MLCHYLRGKGASVVGIDHNVRLPEIASQNVNAEFLCADATQSAATCGKRFDVVFLLNILEHFPPDKVVAMLRELRGLPTHCGFILVRTPTLNKVLGAAHFARDFTSTWPQRC
jgi:2-polyprenyl-3-methyl-5-hydroxy-6-metoxy-1,4-benzoquinol methylase